MSRMNQLEFNSERQMSSEPRAESIFPSLCDSLSVRNFEIRKDMARQLIENGLSAEAVARLLRLRIREPESA